MSRRIDRWTRQLIAHEPADAQVNAVKAEAYVTLVAAGWTGGRNEVGEDLALSVAQDALRVQAAPLTAAQAPGGHVRRLSRGSPPPSCSDQCRGSTTTRPTC